MKILLGTKMGMSRMFADDGTAVPLTGVAVGSCTVVQIRSDEKGGNYVQLGIHATKKLGKARAGHLKDLPLLRTLKTFRLRDDVHHYTRGQSVGADLFTEGDTVAVTGISKGKGFAGVMKRHGFHGHPATHGHKDSHRAPGSIGAGGVQRVMKGRRMAGRMGGARVTVKNLQVAKVDAPNGMLYLKGAVPGPRNAVVMIKEETARAKK